MLGCHSRTRPITVRLLRTGRTGPISRFLNSISDLSDWSDQSDFSPKRPSDWSDQSDQSEPTKNAIRLSADPIRLSVHRIRLSIDSLIVFSGERSFCSPIKEEIKRIFERSEKVSFQKSDTNDIFWE